MHKTLHILGQKAKIVFFFFSGHKDMNNCKGLKKYILILGILFLIAVGEPLEL